MFRHLLMAMVVYENSFVGSYTKHICGLLIWGWEGIKWVRDLVSGLSWSFSSLQRHNGDDEPFV
jgi:hypothetical protein